MADSLSKEARSENMRRIRSRNTKPEVRVRSALHRMGYRFRLHDRKLPGSPDIVLKKRRTVVFVHGCFWHRHPGCKYAYTPKSNVERWENKFRENVERDTRNRELLQDQGWRVIVVWECEINSAEDLSELLRQRLQAQCVE